MSEASDELRDLLKKATNEQMEDLWGNAMDAFGTDDECLIYMLGVAMYELSPQNLVEQWGISLPAAISLLSRILATNVVMDLFSKDSLEQLREQE